MEKTEFELPSKAIKNADGSVSLQLCESIEIAGNEIFEVTLHPLKAGDILNSQNIEKTGDRTRFLIQACLKKPGFDGEKLVNELSIADLTDISAVMGFFTTDGRKTSVKS